MTGKLIVFEGLDSSGKATQTGLLIKKLKEQNIPVEKIDFPQYGNWSAAFVEKYLNGEFGTPNEVGPYRASLFYALDRYAKLPQLKKWLNQDKIIIANRYVGSNQAFQGGKIKNEQEREKFLRWLDNLEFDILGLPKPTLVIYLFMPLKTTLELMEKRRQRKYIKNGNKDIHEADRELLENTQKIYNSLAKTNPNWIIIECTENGQLLIKEQIHQKVWREIEKMLD